MNPQQRAMLESLLLWIAVMVLICLLFLPAGCTLVSPPNADTEPGAQTSRRVLICIFARCDVETNGSPSNPKGGK